MKNIFLVVLFCNAFLITAQKKAYEEGEWLNYRVHYGFITAGYALLEIDETNLNDNEVYHVKGEGKTTGISKWFFNVEDYYQTYIDKENEVPLRFIRKIDEGGYTKDIQIDFDHQTGRALVHNKKHKTKEHLPFPDDAQDMVSSLYYLRNNLDIDQLKNGDEIDMNMFFDKENYKFKLKFLGREIIKTKFGKVACLVFRPYVQSGRVFKEKESLTVWISDDDNKIPLLVKADLAVGSLKATLIGFKGLRHSFKIVVD
jgi:hypothetical protein